MEHVLDNPAWGALVSGNKALANGNEYVRYFEKTVSPFVGLNEATDENFAILHKTLPHSGPAGFISPLERDIPPGWKILHMIPCLQMVYDVSMEPEPATLPLTPLTDAHIPQMLELTALTKPGPFAERTIDFGYYYGVWDDDKLVAMAGQRMHCFNYAEVSAVCTHPDYTGRGLARQLLLFHINRVISEGNVPYLHVRADNYNAISVYQKTGFKSRRTLYFYILQKEGRP